MLLYLYQQIKGIEKMKFTDKDGQNFNIKLRQMAIKHGLKINEYGIFKKEKLLAGKTEEDIFKILGMSYVEPELREDTGEIERALEHTLPHLVELKQIPPPSFHIQSRVQHKSNNLFLGKTRLQHTRH